MVTLVSVRASTAPPLNRPAALASFTTPSARAPFGMATFPSTSTGDSTVAVNLSPDLLVFELMVWSKTTAITVSAGTTRGFGSMAFFTAVFAASAMYGEELASGLDCWSAAFWHPATSMPTDKADNEIVAKQRFIKSSRGWKCVSFKDTLICCEVNLPCANSKRRFRPDLASLADSVPLNLYRFGFDERNPILLSAIRTLSNQEIPRKSMN